MLYQRSLEIEQRLKSVLKLVRMGDYSTPKIAEVLGVSIPTVSRDVTALRERGHEIRAERASGGWRYYLAPKRRNSDHSATNGLAESRKRPSSATGTRDNQGG